MLSMAKLWIVKYTYCWPTCYDTICFIRSVGVCSFILALYASSALGGFSVSFSSCLLQILIFVDSLCKWFSGGHSAMLML